MGNAGLLVPGCCQQQVIRSSSMKPIKSFCSSDSELPFSKPDAEVGKFREKISPSTEIHSRLVYYTDLTQNINSF